MSVTALDYERLVAQKAAALADHEKRKLAHRQLIVNEILRDPPHAIAMAQRTLENKKAAWQQWSVNAWRNLLTTHTPEDLALILLNPRGDQEALADSHPFAGLLTTARGY